MRGFHEAPGLSLQSVAKLDCYGGLFVMLGNLVWMICFSWSMRLLRFAFSSLYGGWSLAGV